MENTLENKAKFFAQYWRQLIMKNSVGIAKFIVDEKTVNSKTKHLELKPLSSISDEDLKGLNDILDWGTNIDTTERTLEWVQSLNEGYILGGISILNGCDYLRSKCYALPWNGITVEQQIEYGWIKLKE